MSTLMLIHRSEENFRFLRLILTLVSICSQLLQLYIATTHSFWFQTINDIENKAGETGLAPAISETTQSTKN